MKPGFPLVLFFVTLAVPLAAQPAPCNTPEHDTLDFWVGTWNLSWPVPGDSTGQMTGGTNTIARSYNGCVIEEHFVAETGFAGMSTSVYHRASGEWRQTWVDNGGSYLLLTGGRAADGQVYLRTAPFTNPQGQTQINRMTWTDVTPDALTWHWQRSLDDGATWTTMWAIRYTRRL